MPPCIVCSCRLWVPTLREVFFYFSVLRFGVFGFVHGHTTVTREYMCLGPLAASLRSACINMNRQDGYAPRHWIRLGERTPLMSAETGDGKRRDSGADAVELSSGRVKSMDLMDAHRNTDEATHVKCQTDGRLRKSRCRRWQAGCTIVRQDGGSMRDACYC